MMRMPAGVFGSMSGGESVAVARARGTSSIMGQPPRDPAHRGGPLATGARPDASRGSSSGRPSLVAPLTRGARVARGLARPVGQRDLEARADARFRANPDLAAEQRRVAAHDGEPEPHAAGAVRSPVDLMEGFEDGGQVLLRDAGARVLDA